jgi:pyruvate,orthophosphate dikinase
MREIKQLAEEMGVAVSVIEHRLHALHELNPMLGHRGCRLGITHPEIYIMQVDAIISAISGLYDEDCIISNLEIMIPLISSCRELEEIKSHITMHLKELEQQTGKQLSIKIGTMIELPRACLIAENIAKYVDYFSFGTNDLTQTTYGISRDDIGSFLPDYISKKIFDKDPFIKIDETGVGELIKIAVERGKAGNRNLTFGVCGEHAGDPESINLFDKLGLDYISCSPYRIPIARVAAAQSAIKRKAV